MHTNLIVKTIQSLFRNAIGISGALLMAIACLSPQAAEAAGANQDWGGPRGYSDSSQAEIKELASSECQSRMGSCDYYSCMNEKMQCRPEQYFTRFAKRYCDLFEAEGERFTEEGRQTLSKIKNCLQEKVANESGLTCDNALSLAYGHHRDCYLASGFCELATDDKFSILGLVYPELQRLGFQKAMLETIGGCISGDHRLDEDVAAALKSRVLRSSPVR